MLVKKSKTNMLTYPLYIGKLVIHLHSLETVLRTCLLVNDIGDKKSIEITTKYHNLVLGQEVDDDAFTNYDQLKCLIKKYNEMVSLYSLKKLKIDDYHDLVNLRDAIAHGRAFYQEVSPPYTTMILLKFSNPKKTGKTKVVYMEVMNNDWLEDKINLVLKEYNKVVKAYNRIKKSNLNKTNK